MDSPVANEPTLNTMTEKIEKYQVVVVTDEMLKSAKQQFKTRSVRKESEPENIMLPWVRSLINWWKKDY